MPTYGASSAGPLDFDRLSEDGEAVVDYARTRHEEVIAFGVSTGAAIAADVAARRELAALVLEAPLILLLEPQLWLSDNGLDAPLLNRIAFAWIEKNGIACECDMPVPGDSDQELRQAS